MTDTKGGLYFGERIIQELIDVLENGSRVEQKRLAAKVKAIAVWPGEVKKEEE